MTVLQVPVSVGELLDKISILEIKLERIEDPAKRENIGRELVALCAARDAALTLDDTMEATCRALREVNEQLWDIEDAIREKERQRKFDEQFVDLARRVYRTNDERAALKRQLNELTGSTLVEEKSYTDYG
jgi:Mg2+ and Co2+ transporter CorA